MVMDYLGRYTDTERKRGDRHGRTITFKMASLKKGITQRQLSKLTGIGECYISLASRGRYVPTERQQDLIAGVLGVAKADLFEGN